MHLHDMSAMYTKFLSDIQDAQVAAKANGSIPEVIHNVSWCATMQRSCCVCMRLRGQVVPNYEHGPCPPDPAWGAACT